MSLSPLLIKHVPSELLYLYLVASSLAIKAILVQETGDKKYPVYYISHTLRDAKT